MGREDRLSAKLLASSKEMEIEMNLLEDGNAMMFGVANTAALASITRTNEDEDDTPPKTNLVKLAVSNSTLLSLRN